jgi:arsenite methyltransferase
MLSKSDADREVAMSETPSPGPDREQLREAIRNEYREVAHSPNKGFHFHTGRRLAQIVEYRDEWLDFVPESVLESFAGTGNPFSMGLPSPGEHVVDLACGAGIDSFIAAAQVGTSGAVIGIDMTDEMLDKGRRAREAAGIEQLEFRRGYLEEIPVEDAWADIVISNGSINLSPDKGTVFGEIHRVLKPGGRIQIGDIMVHEPVSDKAKTDIDLWTG